MLNLTITVPDGSSNHGNPNLLCTPPYWYDYVLFYFTNYFAHAATVITTPGQGRKKTILVVLLALLFPGVGILRAMDAIRRHSRFESDPLRAAVRAGALCMVVRARPDQRRETDRPDLEEGRAGVLQSEDEKPDAKNNPAGPSREQLSEPDNIQVPVDAATSNVGDGAKKLQETERRVWNFRLKLISR